MEPQEICAQFSIQTIIELQNDPNGWKQLQRIFNNPKLLNLFSKDKSSSEDSQKNPESISKQSQKNPKSISKQPQQNPKLLNVFQKTKAALKNPKRIHFDSNWKRWNKL